MPREVLWTLLVLGAVSVCDPYELSPEAKSVQLVKAYPPSTCKELGRVWGAASNGDDARSNAQAELRERAAKMGANYVRSEAYDVPAGSLRTTISGTAYRCPTADGPTDGSASTPKR